MIPKDESDPIDFICARCNTNLTRCNLEKKIYDKWYCIDCLSSMSKKWIMGLNNDT